MSSKKLISRSIISVFVFLLSCLASFAEETIHRVAGLDLEVPIEMSMIPCGSLAIRAQDFNRTKVRLNDADYDGSPLWYFEIVAKNADHRDKVITLKTDAGPKATITVPANTASPIRFRTAAFLPDRGWALYYLNLPVTTSDFQLIVWTSRIIIQQTNATRTRIQIPLFGRHGNPHLYNWAIYNEGPPVWPRVTSNVSSGHWEELGHSRRWQKESNKYAEMAPGPCWTFEVLLQVAKEGRQPNSCTLWNETTNEQVAASEVSNARSTYTLHYADFPDNAAGFADGHEYGIRTKGYSSNPPCVAEARLYLKLVNLSKVQILYTVGYEDMVYAHQEKINDYAEIFLDASKYTAPTFHFESYGSCPHDQQVILLSESMRGHGSVRGRDVPGSGIRFHSNLLRRERTGPIPLTGAKSYHVRFPVSPKNVITRNIWLLIDVQQPAPTIRF